MYEAGAKTVDCQWWETPWFALVMILAAAVPLLWPALPPLSDLPGHMGRWHIATALPTSPDLQLYYAYQWALVPNLGMDLLVPGLARWLGLEPATKVAVTAIPMLTVAGLLWTAREVHGRIPPTAIFALPLAYAWPFQFGFVNFALSQALAFCAFALWIRLGRQNRVLPKAVLFMPIAFVVWIAHSFGWGMLGLMAAAAELAQIRRDGRRWLPALVTVAVRCLPLALPLIVMIVSALQAPAGGGAVGLGAANWFDGTAKLLWAISILRDRWLLFDVASVMLFVAVLYVAARSPKLSFSSVLGWPALACLAAFAILPRLMMGGAYVDMRMAPAVVMLAVLAIMPPTGDLRFAKALAIAGTAFLALRLVGTTVSFVERSGEQQRELAAIARIPHGVAVLSLVQRPCGNMWSDLRRDALPGMAIVRRDVFTNAQWALEGQQLLHIRYVPAAPYLADPSQIVLPKPCRTFGSDFDAAIARFPRDAFSYVWTIGFPPGAAKASDLRVSWTNGESTLYRVVR
ncbi:hypothetical protein EV283_0415 [Sphingomonas sp. BK036]|nr:hypothetical protein EV283_0415 [Sphingomonas sp. BK036]